MTAPFAIADVASLVGEPTRAAILLALLDGRALSAGELARAAKLSAPATSLHLAKLTHGRLLIVQKQGRHRYYRLANADVAHVLEALGTVATAPRPARPVSQPRSVLRAARTCYDHLAGSLSVELAALLERDRILDSSSVGVFDVSHHGARWFADVMQIDVSELAQARRPLARKCLDWTERRPHVGGALGAAVLECLFARHWVARVSGCRALRITTRGRAEFAKLGLGAALTDCLG
jgi:DNA-binding transcriptional ArsR family regulator